MHMLNALTAVLTAVIDDSVSVFKTERFCNLGDFCEDVRDNTGVFLGNGVGAADVDFRNYKHVHGSLRFKVVKREDLVILINFF